MPITVDLKGEKELQAALKKAMAELGPEKVEPILLESGERIRDAVKDKTPVGETGNLKKAVIARRMGSFGSKYSAKIHPTIAAMDWNYAKHHHLVEYGHRMVGPKPDKKDTGKRVRAKSYFWRTVRKVGPGEIEGVRDKLLKMVEGVGL